MSKKPTVTVATPTHAIIEDEDAPMLVDTFNRHVIGSMLWDKVQYKDGVVAVNPHTNEIAVKVTDDEAEE